MQVIDQLIERFDARRKELPVLHHEALEVRPGIGPFGMLLEELVEVADHVADPGQLFRRHALDALFQPLEVVLQDLLAKLVGQRIERIAGVRIHEFVVAEPIEPPSHAGGQGVQPVAALLRGPAQHLLGHSGLVLICTRWGVE